MKTSCAILALSCVGYASAFVQPATTSSFATRTAATRSSSSSSSRTALSMVTKDQLVALKKDIVDLLDKSNAAPILVRLAWHDAGTYDKNVGDDKWPTCGGANGSIRFSPEIEHGCNAGLPEGFKLLKQIKAKHDGVSWADVLQMASATAIEEAGGPKIDMVYGRVDAAGPEGCTPEGRLPAGGSPFPDKVSAEEHIRRVFYRMGFDDTGIVALSGAHTLGRAFPERSGFGKESTKYTDNSSVIRIDGKAGHGRKGGQSWTKQWLKFDNSYYSAVPENDEDLLKLETDKALFKDEKMRPIALKYKNDEAAFFDDYAAAHKKLSELGAKFEPSEGVKID